MLVVQLFAIFMRSMYRRRCCEKSPFAASPVAKLAENTSARGLTAIVVFEPQCVWKIVVLRARFCSARVPPPVLYSLHRRQIAGASYLVPSDTPVPCTNSSARVRLVEDFHELANRGVRISLRGGQRGVTQ